MGKKEKLFTKLTELMVGEWWRRIGGQYNLPTKKSGTEDVELIYKRRLAENNLYHGFAVYNGNRYMIIRKKLEAFLESAESI